MNKTVSHIRIAVLFLGFFLVYSIIIMMLVWTQIINHTFYQSLGRKQYSITITQLPPRAAIFDRNGKYLALNTESTAAFIVPHDIENRPLLDSILQTHFPEAYTRLLTCKDKKFMYIKRKLSPEQIAIIKQSGSPDIHLLQEPCRYYPLSAASCIIGITDSDNQGLLGIEKYYNDRLAGTPTTATLQKDARSGLFYFAKDTQISGTDGSDIYLTIDSNLQFLTHQALQECVTKFGAKEGIALIMDPDNGHILAMANVPSFDPANTKQLDLDSTKIRAITQHYELGSVFKVFAALAALEQKVVTIDEEIDCKNNTTAYIDGRRINTVHAHGIIPFKDVVALSNNIGIAIVAKRLGENLFDHYQRLGFGKKTGIDIPGESPGFLNSPYNWSKQSVISLSYGYEVCATILQLGCAFCLIARDGIPVKPVLIYSDSEAATLDAKPYYSQETITIIKDILYRTTQYGTAQRAAIKGYKVMTKTGTANMLIEGVYDSQKNRYTCAGILEKGTYKRVIVTFIQEADRPNLFASTVAVPLHETIAQRMLIAERIV
ncbi:MAG TPA: penicillin-binding protein 2 [Candidatus Babeliales bacterium]|jgi:cell division protein FtsI (penicillin-binding protein 3)|nr:penicillin-binding protein 2 [Candidatus Babeliales bacterium]